MNYPTILSSGTDLLLMIMKFSFRKILSLSLLILLSLVPAMTFADLKQDIPSRPNPPKLVNDLAGMMTPAQQESLEQLLVNYDNTTSSQVAVVTVPDLKGYDIAEYAIQLFNSWGIGRKGKNNGVLILASAGDRKMWIVTGQGMEGALTDALTGRIVRNEMVPEFKAGNYYKGFEKAANAIIAATKGEYTNDDPPDAGKKGGGIVALIVLAIIIIVILAAIRGGGGGGGGNYMSRRGGDFITGAILGSLLGGGGSGGGGWGSGGGSSGGGGFGGFGGGYSGGGGAGGSW